MFKALRQHSRRPRPCVMCSDGCSSGIANSDLATKQGQALQMYPSARCFFNAGIQTVQSRWAGLSLLPCRCFKESAFSSLSLSRSLAAFFFFLMEKEERKMKSIFNVYRGAGLNCLHNVETILNKLIFNERPLCMRMK